MITAVYTQFMLANMIPTRHTHDLILGMWELLQHLGWVCRGG